MKREKKGERQRDREREGGTECVCIGECAGVCVCRCVGVCCDLVSAKWPAQGEGGGHISCLHLCPWTGLSFRSSWVGFYVRFAVQLIREFSLVNERTFSCYDQIAPNDLSMLSRVNRRTSPGDSYYIAPAHWCVCSSAVCHCPSSSLHRCSLLFSLTLSCSVL